MRRDGEMKPLILGDEKAEYFFAQDWTAKITLKGLGKFRFTRRRSCEAFEPPGTAPSDRFARWAAGRGVQSRRAACEASSVVLVSTAQYAEPVIGRAFARPVGHCALLAAMGCGACVGKHRDHAKALP